MLKLYKTQANPSSSSSMRGLTLIELLISMGLFSVIALTVGTLFMQSSQRSVEAQNASALGTDVMEFVNAMDTYLEGSVGFSACLCNKTDSSCVFKNLDESTAYTTTAPTSLIDFYTESANDPSQVSTAASGCQWANPNPRTSGYVDNSTLDFYARGCEKHISIIYTPPTSVSGSGPYAVGNPGRLTIRDLTNSIDLHTLNGVYFINCGMNAAARAHTMGYSAAGTTAGSSTFTYEIRVKTRSNNKNSGSTLTDVESWHPSDSSFDEGIHRQITSSVSFRNLSVRGIHYGRPESVQNCDDDGSPKGNCCSGYDDGINCIPPTSCKVSGTGSPYVEICCSKMISAGNCL